MFVAVHEKGASLAECQRLGRRCPTIHGAARVARREGSKLLTMADVTVWRVNGDGKLMRRELVFRAGGFEPA